MYKLLVASVADPICAAQPQTQAVTAIFERWGFDYRPLVDYSWIGWPSKAWGFMRTARELAAGGEYTHLMFVDARDIVLLASPDEVMERYFALGHPWVYNAEPNIWSPKSFKPEDYPTPRCTYRYLNAGACIGEVAHIHACFDKWTGGGRPPMNMPGGDQDWMAARFIEGYPDAIGLDLGCYLFQCMCGSLVGDNPHCTIEPGKVYNNVTNTEPVIIHFNGGDDITADNRRLLWAHLI